ncbi:ca2+-binding domain protein [Vibrio cholerae]|nr:ca2+-binding domain protein [Vibrio cholerae]
MYRIDATIERKTRDRICPLHQLELTINGHGLFVGIRALWQVVFMYVQALYIGEVRLIVIDFDGQYYAVAIAIKVSGNHFEIQCQAIAIQRVINRC